MKKFTFCKLLAIMIVGLLIPLLYACGDSEYSNLIYRHDGYSISSGTEWTNGKSTLIITLKKDLKNGDEESYDIRIPLENEATQKLLRLIKNNPDKDLIIEHLKEVVTGRVWAIDGTVSILPPESSLGY